MAKDVWRMAAPRGGHRIMGAASAAMAALLLLAWPAGIAGSQDGEKPKSPTAIGTGSWGTKVKAGVSGEEMTLTPKQLAEVKRINAYLNSIKRVKGDFLQTGPDNETSKGKFLVQRPGQLRFDYAKPSMLQIVSDGRFVAVQDLDLKTSDTYPIASTPLRLVLGADVDLTRDGRILAFQDLGDRLALTLEDRTGEAAGQIRLIFSKEDASLLEWIITDPQGLNTKIEVANLEPVEKFDPSLFKVGGEIFINFNED